MTVPVVHQMLDELQPGDTVVVWKLDRLSRSLMDVLRIMDRIEEARAGFRSLTESLDTTTPAGRMLMQVVGSFAEFERSLIRERTLAGLAAARAAGRIGGRPRKLDEDGRKEIAEAVLSRRHTGVDMARLCGVSKSDGFPDCGRVSSKQKDHLANDDRPRRPRGGRRRLTLENT